MKAYMGLDVGSVSVNIVVIDEAGEVLTGQYLQTKGRPIAVIQEGMKIAQESLGRGVEIAGAGTTGSGRYLAGVIIGSDVVKNEITAHAVAASMLVPDVQTVFEIGGQDSKIIILRNGIVTDFAMNTVCAAGTGSFLDQQAARVLIFPLQSSADWLCNLIHRCGLPEVYGFRRVRYDSQAANGHSIPDIIRGLCDALVRNYLNNVGKGKEILPPVAFQGVLPPMWAL